MNIPSPQNMNGGFGGNGFADIIKSQMLTMTMISSMNGNGNANSNQNIFALHGDKPPSTPLQRAVSVKNSICPLGLIKALKQTHD